MKNIEKALTNFVSGKGQRVSDEALCAHAKKDTKSADEIIDILFNVINRELDYVTGAESLDKVRELLNCVNMIMSNSDTVNRKIVARRTLKLTEKIDRIQIENRNKFLNVKKACEELEKTKVEVMKVAVETEEAETKAYDFMNCLIDTVKDIQSIEVTFKKVPSLVNAKDRKEIPLFENILIKYINSIEDKKVDNALYYCNLLNLISSQRSFDIKEKDKRKCLELIHTEINKLSITKKIQKRNKENIESLRNVIDIIQGKDDKEQKIDEIASKHNIEVFFKPHILEQAKLIKGPKEGAMTGREEIEDYTVTIDGDHVLEIDDALSCRKLDNGNYLLGVHTASVLGYADYDSEFIQTAISRGRSIYLPKKYQTIEGDFDRVIPIFPYEFATNTASLIEGEPRLTRSYYFEIDKNGNVVDERFVKTIIRVNKRLTYEEVDKILKQGTVNKKLGETIKNLETVTARLQKKYKGTEIYEQVKENIDDFNELRVKNVGSQKIVYQTMLVTGNRVAEKFYKNNWPLDYRIHEVNNEDVQKIEKMVENLNKTYGGRQFNQLFEILSGLYPTGSYGLEGAHHGLKLSHYAHCTSRIRRGADILEEHCEEVCFDKEPTKEELINLRNELDSKITLLNLMKDPINLFAKDYKRVYQKRR